MTSSNTDILISLGQTIPTEQLQARWLFSNNGIIYVSFDGSVSDSLKQDWLEVLATVDEIIEPEFAIVAQGNPLSQATIKQSSSSTIGGASGIYRNTYIIQTSGTGQTSILRGDPSSYSIEIASSAYSHKINFADSDEAGWKHVAFHELGHALALEHSHDFDDGDGDGEIDTNGTVMSYISEVDRDGDPSYSTLDRQALIQIHGGESGSITTPASGATPVRDLLLEQNFRRIWKTPSLRMAFESGSTAFEPNSGSVTHRLVLTRYDGSIDNAAIVYLDWDISQSVNWTYTNPQSGFHDVLIPDNSVSFDPGQDTASVDITILADSNAENGEWLEVTARAARTPNYFQGFPAAPLRLTLNDPLAAFNLSLTSNIPIAGLLTTIPTALSITADQPRDIAPSDGASINVSAPGWSDTIQLIRISKAGAAGSRLTTRQPETGFATKVGSLIVGGDGNDVITGGFGWDIADGGAGNDLVKTGNGRDILTGGLGADELWGGFGWNTFRSEQDGSQDLLVIRSDQWLINPRQNNTAFNNADGSKADVIEGLDSLDLIKIQGVASADISVRAGASNPFGVNGIGIYAGGALEAIYTGNDLSTTQLQAMVSGDNSQAAIDNTIFAYGTGWAA